MDDPINIKYCGKCGSLTTVVDSRPNDKGHIYRRRECPRCLTRFTTHELRYDQMRSMKGKLDLLDRIIKLAKSKETIR